MSKTSRRLAGNKNFQNLRGGQHNWRFGEPNVITLHKFGSAILLPDAFPYTLQITVVLINAGWLFNYIKQNPLFGDNGQGQVQPARWFTFFPRFFFLKVDFNNNMLVKLTILDCCVSFCQS